MLLTGFRNVRTLRTEIFRCEVSWILSVLGPTCPVTVMFLSV